MKNRCKPLSLQKLCDFHWLLFIGWYAYTKYAILKYVIYVNMIMCFPKIMLIHCDVLPHMFLIHWDELRVYHVEFLEAVFETNFVCLQRNTLLCWSPPPDQDLWLEIMNNIEDSLFDSSVTLDVMGNSYTLI